MNERRLGRTGLTVSEIGYGAWGIGGDMWLGAQDEESLEALNRAVENGVSFVDTALAYGSWYLRYLLAHYEGSELLALAAYNAGEGKVDEWYRDASARGEEFEAATHIPFPETRSYVADVLEARERYERQYRRELGL